MVVNLPKKKESYEELFVKLENIVENMGNENLSLDESMKQYEDGVALTNRLYKVLNEAEGKIKIIKENEERIFLEGDESE